MGLYERIAVTVRLVNFLVDLVNFLGQIIICRAAGDLLGLMSSSLLSCCGNQLYVEFRLFTTEQLISEISFEIDCSVIV